jgi:nitroreductase
MPSRRAVLALAGGGCIAAATGWIALAPGLPDPAAAWANPGAGERDPRRWALAHALLAPNPHNMQPWRADLRRPGRIILSLDTRRLLPATDPFGRQIMIGCGAFLELLAMAAAVTGHRAQVALFPAGTPGPQLDARPFADVTFQPAASVVDPLFRHIQARHTNRLPYDTARIPPAAALAAVAAAGSDGGAVVAHHSADPARVAALRAMVFAGWERELATPAATAESVAVMRIGDRAIARHRDGIVMGGPLMNLLAASGLATPAALIDPASGFNRQGAALWKAMADTAPAFVWQISADNSRQTQIATGRAFMRMALAATAQGLALHPWSMALQEYPAMADLYARQQAMLGGRADAPVQMLVRAGYAPAVPAAPRRGLAELVQAPA